MVLCCVRLRFEKFSPMWIIVGREYKILMVEFFNSLEMRVQRSEFKGEKEVLFPAEDRGPVKRSCTKHAYAVAADRREEGSESRSIGRSGGRPTENVRSY